MSKVVDLHRAGAPKELGIYIITCSTSRYHEPKTSTKTNDISGDIIEQLVRNAGHRLEGRKLIPDSRSKIRSVTRAALASKQVDCIIITGGTGLSPYDITIESIRPFYQKEVFGFGELFRALSYQEIGTSTIQSRAIGGLSNGTLIFCLPGSTGACRTGWEKILRGQLDVNHEPCNFVELIPRFDEA